MEYNYTTTGSTALRASMQIFTDETYTEAYLGLFEIHNVSAWRLQAELSTA